MKKSFDVTKQIRFADGVRNIADLPDVGFYPKCLVLSEPRNNTFEVCFTFSESQRQLLIDVLSDVLSNLKGGVK